MFLLTAEEHKITFLSGLHSLKNSLFVEDLFLQECLFCFNSLYESLIVSCFVLLCSPQVRALKKNP